MTLPPGSTKLFSSGGNPEIMPDEDQLTDKADVEKGRSPEPARSEGNIYEIRVKGQLSRQWADWLEGLEAKLLENGEMSLSGRIVDQAALMGILNKLNRLNLTIISVREINPQKENFIGDTNEQHTTTES